MKEHIKKHCSKRKRGLKLGSLAHNILISLATEIKSVGELLTYLNESGAFDILWTPRWHEKTPRAFHYTRSQLTNGLARMEKNGLICRKDKRTVFLTEKGVMEILKYRMRCKNAQKKWDGKWRLIVFDIKEVTRKDRDFLRRQLKWIGFEELQKSVWIFPYEIRDELKEFIRMCEMEFTGDVRFIIANSIDPDVLLRKKFNLLTL